MKILIVDDEKSIRFAIRKLFEKKGDILFEASSGEEALDFLKENQVDAAIVDYQMDKMTGLELLKEIKEHYRSVQVLIITAVGNERVATQAIKAGAYDYIKKPFDNQTLLNRMDHIRLTLDARAGQSPKQYGYYLSPESAAILKKIETIAKTGLPVLITGESGTGKELIAKTCHSYSERPGRFIAVNCSALPAALIESELFGAEKGAYTGSAKTKQGFFELANGGTIFLDEIGELPLELQATLLRVLQENEIVRVGGGLPIPIDARVIAATNRRLTGEEGAQNFREDLYYRLNVVNLHLPPLRERHGEVLALALIFLNEFNQKYGKKITGFTDGVLGLFEHYSWPGNIRQLRNMVEQAVVFCSAEWINESLITLPGDPAGPDFSKAAKAPENSPGPYFTRLPANLTAAKQQFEKEYLAYYLDKNEWNIKKTAGIIGMYRQDLHKKIKKYGLTGP